MHAALSIALILVAIANAIWAYVNMMVLDNGLTVGLSAISSISCLFAAAYLWSVP